MLYQVPTGHEKSARGERSRSEKIQRRRGPAGWSLRWVNALCVLFFVLQMSAGQKTIQCQGKPAIDLTAELKRFDEPRLKLLLDFFAAHFLRWSTIRWSWITHFLTLMLFGQNNNINIRPGAASCMVCLTFFCSPAAKVHSKATIKLKGVFLNRYRNPVNTLSVKLCYIDLTG